MIGEYALFDPESGLNEEAVAVPNNLKGFYIQANYHFWPEFLDNTFLGSRFDSPTFTGAFQYGAIEIDDDGDADSGDNERDDTRLV